MLQFSDVFPRRHYLLDMLGDVQVLTVWRLHFPELDLENFKVKRPRMACVAHVVRERFGMHLENRQVSYL